MTEAYVCRRGGPQLPDVLPLVVQHCPDLSTASDLRSLLQVSSSCRQHLQQSRGHYILCLRHAAKVGDAEGEEDCLPLSVCEKFQGLEPWLVQHAGLVSGLNLWCTQASPRKVQVMQHMLAALLRSCRWLIAQHQAAAAPTGSGPTTASTTTWSPIPAPAPAPAPALQLQLQSAHFAFLPVPLLLQELAAAGLQKLVIHALWQDTAAAAFAAGFSCLTSLRSFRCRCVEAEDDQLQLPWQHLTRLTELSSGLLMPCAVLQLPCSLQRLTATFHADDTSSCMFDLSHLTALVTLEWSSTAQRHQSQSARLPPSLSVLTVYGRMHVASGGEGLQQVEVQSHMEANLPLLRSLSRLQQPWSLSLCTDALSDTSPAGWQEAAVVISTATALTELDLEVLQSASAAKWAPHLAKLPSLRVLSLRGELQREDLLGLTALTALQGLHCEGQDFGDGPEFDALDDFVAASLAASLTGQTALSLESINITNVCLLPALSPVAGLRALSIVGCTEFVVGDVELMSLSRLAQLSKLSLYEPGWTAEGEERFLQGMPFLRYINSTY